METKESSEGLTEAEWQTRKNRIDPQLRKWGWEPKDTTKIIEECDTLQSDFKKRKYLTYEQTFVNEKKSKYCDYLLLDNNGDPLAVIEAKKTSKDPLIGQKQAEEYAGHIKKQTGKDVFVFFTNGDEIWFWNQPYESPRQVWGFHDCAALERLRFQNLNKKNLSQVSVRADIIDRSYQVEAVRRVLEHITQGHRKALMVMATGTGKTRVAMALIDCLLRANAAQRVLFIVDRKVLRDQAKNKGFKRFFPEEKKSVILSGKFETSARLFVSTIQTLMEVYQEINSGFFDVIIFDEAHRSYYHKWRDAFQYFDAIKIGLTATPAELVERDTFRLFDCTDNSPTVYYSYDQAAEDEVLARYKIAGAQTNFQLKGIRPEDIPDAIKRKLLMEKGIEPDELDFEGTEIEKKVAITGTVEAHVKEFMENCLLDSTGTLPAKTIFFAVSKKHAKRVWEAFEKLYPEHKGKLARVIISEDSRALDIKDDFEKQSFPRVAISVDMLDTGVDVPEVCNLVFAKPVFSKIKFWQMIGRGTRADSSCEHKEWLPNGKKERFLIFDFWNNFAYHEMHPEEHQVSASDAVTTRIFNVRIQQLEDALKTNSAERLELIKAKLLSDLEKLPKESIAIRENAQSVRKALAPEFWTSVGIKPAEYLKKHLSPLMRYLPDINMNTASFTLKIEQLALALLRNDRTAIDKLKVDIGIMLECLPMSITKVKEKEDLIRKVLSPKFWKEVTYEDTVLLLEELSPLMHWKRTEPRQLIVLDIDDVVKQRKLIEFGPLGNPHEEYVGIYKKKVEEKISAIAEQHPTIKKIKQNEALTEADLQKLENTLNSPDLYITEKTLQEAYQEHKGTLVEFIKNILGLYEFPKPEQRINDEFKTFVVEHNFMSADQINFVRTLQTVFAKKKHVEYNDFFDAPFTNFGSNAPTPLFSEDQLKQMVTLCNELEREVFA